MNPTVQRYLPPVLVFGAGVFFAWPPSAPLDLGDDIVRAKSVKWRPSDLADPPWVEPSADPFQEVLVASDAGESQPEQEEAAAPAPTGPAPEQLQSGLKLEGIANMGGVKWAVLNGRPRRPGDIVHTLDAHRNECEIVSVEADHIVVRCLETVTEIRPGHRRSADRSAASTPTSASTGGAAAPADNRSDITAGDAPPPPPL